MTAEEVASDGNLLNSSELLKKIDKLREKNVGKHVPLPQVRSSAPAICVLDTNLHIASSRRGPKLRKVLPP